MNERASWPAWVGDGLIWEIGVGMFGAISEDDMQRAIEMVMKAVERARAAMTAEDRVGVDLLWDRGLVSTAEPHCEGCGCGARFRLNPEVVPGWLIDAVDGEVFGPEAGYPQLCRVERYVDWLSLAQGAQLRIEDDNWPTSQALAWCERLRAAGYHQAYVDVAIWIDPGTVRFAVESWTLVPGEAVPEPLRSEISDDLGTVYESYDDTWIFS